MNQIDSMKQITAGEAKSLFGVIFLGYDLLHYKNTNKWLKVNAKEEIE